MYENRLLKPAIVLFLIIGGGCYAQTSAPAGIFQDSVYPSVKVTTDIQYGSNFNHFTHQNEILLLDIYEADGSVDYLRPLIIYCHGGGFSAGDKTSDHAVEYGNYFAKRGYVLASINYRLAKDNPYDTIDNFETVYQATQDSKSAIRFFHRYANNYCLDTTEFFMMGTSAGGALCLTSAYWDEDEANRYFDVSKWGPLDGSSGNAGYSSNLTAVISCWGGMPDTAWLRNETVPNQLFHGNLDPTVPYTQGYGQSGIYTNGSYNIHEACERDHIESYLHTFWGFGHGVSGNTPEFDTLEQISSDFLFAHLKDNNGKVPCERTIPGAPLSLSVYPNPSDGEFFINNPFGLTTFSGILNLYNVTGQLVRSASVTLPVNSTQEINYSNLPAGIYILKLSDQSGDQLFKLMIH